MLRFCSIFSRLLRWDFGTEYQPSLKCWISNTYTDCMSMVIYNIGDRKVRYDSSDHWISLRLMTMGYIFRVGIHMIINAQHQIAKAYLPVFICQSCKSVICWYVYYTLCCVDVHKAFDSCQFLPELLPLFNFRLATFLSQIFQILNTSMWAMCIDYKWKMQSKRIIIANCFSTDICCHVKFTLWSYTVYPIHFVSANVDLCVQNYRIKSSLD